MIPLADLKRNYLEINEEIDLSIKEVLEKGWFILGGQGELFEKEFAEYCGKQFGVGVNSGTDALELALKSLNIKQGDEVLTAVNTAIPTAMAIIGAGATPVFVDIKEDYLIDVTKIEEKITEKTKAIIPVHLYGQSCDMDKIFEISGKNNIPVIEDCCQAHGAEYKGKKVPIGNVGCFSFYPSKNLGAFGEAGMIVTNNKEVSDKLKLLRNYGQSTKYHADIIGKNSRLDEIQASILRTKLKHLDKGNEKRKELAELYNSKLKEITITPKENENNKHIYHLYVIRVKDRDLFAEELKKRDIGIGIHYPIPLHLQKAFQYLNYKQGDFPIAEKLSKEILSLPMFPELKQEEVEKVCDEINNVLKT